MASNYSRFVNGVTINNVPLTLSHPGEVIWVNGSSVLAKGGIGGSSINPGTYTKPCATIAQALDKCTASRGDIIMVMPGHSETVTTDGGLALDVAGVAIVGLGQGSLRPKIVLDSAAAAAVTVTAANVSIHNFVFEASFADITNATDVTAANVTFSACEFKEEGANLNFVDIINCSSTTNNTADGLTVVDCISTSVDAGIDSFIVTAADLDRLVVKNCRVNHLHANALYLVEALTGKDLTDVLIEDNFYATLKTSGALLISADTTTANNGLVKGNMVGHRDTATELLATAATSFVMIDNKATAADDASGYLLPAADS